MVHALPVLGLFAAALVPMVADASFREHEAHVHGVGTLSIVVEGEALLMELRVPAHDLVGFEHAPHTESQKEAVRGAVEKLNTVFGLFAPPETAGCTLDAVELESGLIDALEHGEEAGHHGDHGSDEHHHEDAHHEDEHEEEGHHDEAHQDEAHHGEAHHEDEHAEHHDHAEMAEHAEFAAMWQVSCADMGALTHLDLGYFAQFERAERLDVQLVTEGGQSAATLTAADDRLELR